MVLFLHNTAPVLCLGGPALREVTKNLRGINTKLSVVVSRWGREEKIPKSSGLLKLTLLKCYFPITLYYCSKEKVKKFWHITIRMNVEESWVWWWSVHTHFPTEPLQHLCVVTVRKPRHVGSSLSKMTHPVSERQSPEQRRRNNGHLLAMLRLGAAELWTQGWAWVMLNGWRWGEEVSASPEWGWASQAQSRGGHRGGEKAVHLGDGRKALVARRRGATGALEEAHAALWRQCTEKGFCFKCKGEPLNGMKRQRS